MTDQPDRLSIDNRVREVASNILHLLLTRLSDPEGGVGIDEVEALIQPLVEQPDLIAEHAPMIAIDDTASKVWVYCRCGFNRGSKTFETDPEEWIKHIRAAVEAKVAK